MTPSDPTAVELKDVSVSFPDRAGGDDVEVLRRVTFNIRPGEFVTVVGPSGCGKSTLLNLIAGLLRPSEGRIAYAGELVARTNTKVGYITQQDNLLPWQSTRKNVELPLRIRHVQSGQRGEIAQRWINIVGLNGFESHYPRELSGGMRKRAAIARTLAYDPETLLLDEPFGALDAQLRIVMQDELLRIWTEAANKTVLFITHDLAEAVALSDRVIVMSGRPGRVLAEFEIPLPRPRVIRDLRFTSEFTKLHEELWKAMEGRAG
ncbi:MAG: ABC transporter ATP-binding protein [Pseudorhodoplanes sp.]|uniref:ABC transporter ATP-binding protein n=1 Tax=Pseudorhodoplanes sp. TaxID=1934341 RepID=UPI003D0C95AF